MYVVVCAACRGMLPGYVSGFYGYDDCHIDLCRLAAFAKARLIHAEANSIDTQVQHKLLLLLGLSVLLVWSLEVSSSPCLSVLCTAC